MENICKIAIEQLNPRAIYYTATEHANSHALLILALTHTKLAIALSRTTHPTAWDIDTDTETDTGEQIKKET